MLWVYIYMINEEEIEQKGLLGGWIRMINSSNSRENIRGEERKGSRGKREEAVSVYM